MLQSRAFTMIEKILKYALTSRNKNNRFIFNSSLTTCIIESIITGASLGLSQDSAQFFMTDELELIVREGFLFEKLVI